MNIEFVKLLLVMIGIAVGFALVIAALVFMGGARRAKRYRPGRPFAFVPVWFLAAPEQHSRAGISRELTAAPSTGRARPRETGGASDRW